ncbi:MAG: DNA primase, partial [SAR202 cluster bacterium]|nr:DNA primase [SAR202 cluster bacterium]
MARIPQEIINRINDTADIVDVVSKYVDLKKRGRNFFGLCPFHNEKTPSFSVAPDKGIYHCFGCGNGGNAVNFIMEYEKISFVDAIQELGGQLGIDVEFSGDNKSKEFFHALYEIHNLAANLYHKTLFSDKGKKAKQYLLDRGIDENLIKLFKIGFAPKNSKFLLESIKAKQYKKDVIEKSGLFGFSNSEIYDRFRSRIMFPIFNTSNKVIAFGGRVFGVDDPAKYMNSPETPLYHKSEIFYGLNLSRDIIHKENYAILVEGYTDVIQLFQAGIKNVIAVSGTAFTEQHVNQIRRLTSKVFLAYDGDSAGTNATLRAGYALLKGGVEPKIIEIPDNLDPDGWVKKEGPTVFKSNGIDKAIGVLNFQLKSSNFSQVSSVEKSNIIKDVLSVVNKIQDPIIQQNLVKGLAQAAGVEENQIIHMLSKQATRYRSRQTIDEKDKLSRLFSTINGKAELG